MKKTTRICALLTAVVLMLSMLLSMTGCNNTSGSNNSENNSTNVNDSTDSAHVTYPEQIYDKYGNAVEMPSDNDAEGWFSVEVVNQYSVPSFTQPEGTTVVSKPERNALYLTGGENIFRLTVSYAFEAIRSNNSSVYTPVLGLGDDGVAAVTGLDKISHIDTDTLYPKGDDVAINLIYKSGHKIYECIISLENNNEQVYIAFADRTELYGSLA